MMAPSGNSGARGTDDGDPQAECVFRCRLALGAKSMATPGDSRQPEVPVNDADDHSGRLGSGVSCRLFPGVVAEDGDVNRLVTPEVPVRSAGGIETGVEVSNREHRPPQT